MPSVPAPPDDKFGKLYAALGVELAPGTDDNRKASACPFPHCGGTKFYVNVRTGQYKCHSANKCGEQGNATTFLRWCYQQHLEATTDDHRRALKAKRGWSPQMQKEFGIAVDADRGEYLLPAFNEKGEVVNLLRYDPATNAKRTLPGLPLSLYGLNGLTSPPENRAQRTLLLCEGLTDLLAVHQQLTEAKTRSRFDLLAVPSAGVFRREWVKYLLVYPSVRVGFDNDKAGHDGQQRVVKEVRESKAAVRGLALMHWPKGTPDKRDLGDLVKNGVSVAGFTKEHCVPVAEERRITFVLGTDTKTETQEWLWQDRLPAGAMASLSGAAGTLKSTTAKDLVARGTAGLPMPRCGKDSALPPYDVVYFTAEDSASQVRDLVRLHNGDLSRLHIHDLTSGDEPVDLLDCLAEVEEYIRKHSARLVVIDPLNSFVGGDISTDAKARRTLSGKLNALARRTGACLLLIRNWGRADVGTGSQRSLGSHSTSDMSRCVMNTEELPRLDRDDDTEPRRFQLVWEKVSGAPQPDPLPYTVKNLSTGPTDRHLRRIVWAPPPPTPDQLAALAGRTATKRRAK